jgi:hypothetical protein
VLASGFITVGVESKAELRYPADGSRSAERPRIPGRLGSTCRNRRTQEGLLEAPAAACAELKIEGLAKAFLSFAEQGRGLSGMRTKLPGAVSFRAKQGPS